MKRGISYRTFAYYQNLLAKMVWGARSGSSKNSGYDAQTKRIEVMTSSEFALQMGGEIAPTPISRGRKIVVIFPSNKKQTATSYVPKAKNPEIKISPDTNTKKGRGVGSSRRSRHYVKQALRVIAR